MYHVNVDNEVLIEILGMIGELKDTNYLVKLRG